MLRAATDGIKARGKSDVGDKTLLDALVPAVDTSKSRSPPGTTPQPPCGGAATARSRPMRPGSMQAMRGRASYTGERSVGTLDAGAVAVAVMFEALADQWSKRPVHPDPRRTMR